jgi:hypothetical protein
VFKPFSAAELFSRISFQNRIFGARENLAIEVGRQINISLVRWLDLPRIGDGTRGLLALETAHNSNQLGETRPLQIIGQMIERRMTSGYPDPRRLRSAH